MTESSSEEELLERSFQETMVSAMVGCKTARASKQARKQLELRKEGGNRGNVALGRGEKGGEVDILVLGEFFR